MVIIAANGTARMIPINHSTVPPIIILMNMKRGLIHSALFMTYGMRMLFSVHCMIKNIVIDATAHRIPFSVPITSSAGTDHNNGPIYGMNSVIHDMSARDHLPGTTNPMKSSTRRPIYTMIPI